MMFVKPLQRTDTPGVTYYDTPVFIFHYSNMTSVGFEPTPVKTTALTLRLRPLGHEVLTCYYLPLQQYTIAQQQIILHTHLLHLHLHYSFIFIPVP